MECRHVLHVFSSSKQWRLRSYDPYRLDKDEREAYATLHGEALCQFLIRRDPESLCIARGPLVFLSGNKATVGYVSPQTRVPHYSFVGGNAAEQLLCLGLDALCFHQPVCDGSACLIVVSGSAGSLQVLFCRDEGLPGGQRSAYYHLLRRELSGQARNGSILTLGDAARRGSISANIAAEAIYHAGRGGAGHVFAGFTQALVLKGAPMDAAGYFGPDSALADHPDAYIADHLERQCARLSSSTGGTIPKLYATGCTTASARCTLPSLNARRLGYDNAGIASAAFLKASREGQTGCRWCQVACRHFHYVDAPYAPQGRDIMLDDFEPAYAIFSMFGLNAAGEDVKSKADLVKTVDRRVILQIEEMGCDIIDTGLALAALFEGVQEGLIDKKDVPRCIADSGGLGDLDALIAAVELMRTPQLGQYPALAAAAHGPQALAEACPSLRDRVFTGGRGTFGNAGHCNALWTFLMPFSRFFGHYSGQLYKVDEKLPPPGSDDEQYCRCFERVVSRALSRECFWILCNAFSQCAFTFIVFSQDGAGESLGGNPLLPRLLRQYGIRASRQDLEWFGRNFWAQSIDLKRTMGWRPPRAADFPARVFEALSLSLSSPADELRRLMDLLIVEWKRQSSEMLRMFGYDGWE